MPQCPLSDQSDRFVELEWTVLNHSLGCSMKEFKDYLISDKHLKCKWFIIYKWPHIYIYIYIFIYWCLVSSKIAIVIFFILILITTSFVSFVAIKKPSISVFRIIIITLGTAMIFSVMICLCSSYIHCHSHRKLTFPLEREPKRTQDSCKKSLSFEETFSHSNLIILK